MIQRSSVMLLNYINNHISCYHPHYHHHPQKSKTQSLSVFKFWIQKKTRKNSQILFKNIIKNTKDYRLMFVMFEFLFPYARLHP